MFSDLLKLDEVNAERCRRSFYIFLTKFWDTVVTTKLVDNWHIKFLCDELQKSGEKILTGQPIDMDVIVNVPPSTSKTTICSILFPAWLWARDPKIKIITSSYAMNIALMNANKSRTVIKSELYKAYFPNVELKDDQDAKGNYETKLNGVRYATATGAAITGLHADIIIVDDPQNPQLANSEKERDNTNTYISETLFNRKTSYDRAIMITIQQRLHPMDVTGYLLSKDVKYNHICLPAQANESLYPQSLISYYKDGFLDPLRLSFGILDRLKKTLGSRAFNTQYLQNPEDDASAIIKRNWVKTLSVAPEKPTVHFYLDTAYTDDTKNDPSAIIAVTKIENDLVVLGAAEVWMELPQLLEFIPKFVIEYGGNHKSLIKIEPKASGKSVAQMLKKSTLNISETKSPTTGKIERLHAVSPTIEGGHVGLVTGLWNDGLMGQLCSNVPLHDDIRDCLVMAIEDLIINKIQSKPRIRVAPINNGRRR